MRLWESTHLTSTTTFRKSTPRLCQVEGVPTTTDMDSSRPTKSPSRRSIAVALTVLAALAAILWFLNSPAVVDVAAAEVVRDDGVTAIVNSCGGKLSVDVYEDDSLVVIKVLDHRFRIRFDGNDCQDAIRIPLTVPLGDRWLIDDSTDGRVPVSVLDP